MGEAWVRLELEVCEEVTVGKVEDDDDNDDGDDEEEDEGEEATLLLTM